MGERGNRKIRRSEGLFFVEFVTIGARGAERTLHALLVTQASEPGADRSRLTDLDLRPSKKFGESRSLWTGSRRFSPLTF